MYYAAVCLLLLGRLAAAQVEPNDNRRPAGNLAAGVLTLQLEIRQALWNSEGEGGPQIPVQVFAEPGRAPTNPGPLIRVRAGARVRIRAHNLLSSAVTLHGLGPHSGAAPPPVAIDAGASRDIEFIASRPGVWFYWGTTTGAALEKRSGIDSQLSGALIVDAPSLESFPGRIFVIGHWSQPGDPKATPPVPDREIWAINGKSWPHTERLEYPLGETIRWLWINATDEDHPLHLHGHYFMVDAAGDEAHWTPFPPLHRRRAVTERMTPGSTAALSWVPQRAGNWLLHCHVLFHVAPWLRLTPAAGEGHQDHDPEQHMAGLVLGIHIAQSKASAPAASEAPHRLRLVVGRREGIDLHGDPGLGYRLAESDGDNAARSGVFTAPGPPIVLTRGQPVEIAVENRLSQSTSVHWHGIELESYYDGVPGWGGEGRHITPPIAPGETFVARFTPPRSGTFMYHTHLNDYLQLSTGLYGPLIIVDPGQRFDPESDKIFLLSRGGTDDEKDPFLINGSAAPAPLELVAGRRYRFRFIGITPAPHLEVSMPATWRRIAKDGADLPASQRLQGAARVVVFPGETYDFEFRPRSPGRLRLTALQPFFKLQSEVPIVVRKP